MNSCLCFFLVWCLTVPEPSYSLTPQSTFDDSASTREFESHGSCKTAFLMRLLRNPNLRSTADKCEEQQQPVCDPSSPYRTYDGTCNNLQNPTWGSVADCLVRILPPSYEGESGLRNSVNGDPLPNPRDLSLSIFPNRDRPVPHVTFLFTTFGQIVAHDQSLSGPAGGDDLSKEGINCCPISDAENPDCAAIAIRPDDPFYSHFNITCLNFLRGINCRSCKDTGKRHNSNFVTSAIDVNIAYGGNESQADDLRTKEGGKLKTRHTRSGELLLENTDPILPFCPVMDVPSCFITGDVRVNQHTNLASLQTMLAREHNRVAHNLKIINPHWDDEKLYQTARKILGAKIQAITYKEFLPILLGRNYMIKFNLLVKRGGEGTQYDPSLRFGTWIEHSTSTFRGPHSMIPTETGYRGMKFRDLYSNNHPILEGDMSQVLKGSCNVPSQQSDHYFVPDVTNLMYKQPNDNVGLDMVAFDILRGRDHGLPPYVHVLNYCSCRNGNITEFEELSAVMPQRHIDLLRMNYNYVQDVDLYVGMLLEDITEGAVLTPTAACVEAGQFYFMKFGDRFYFEHVNEAPSFTAAQRESLKKSSIARMICDNNDIKRLQKNALLFPSISNPILPCGKLPDVDLNLWKSWT